MDLGTTLMFSMVFGAFGFGYFIYGKKQQKFIPLVSGIALMVYPYFFSNMTAMILVGLALIALPFIIKS